jgi:hypothetical protein
VANNVVHFAIHTDDVEIRTVGTLVQFLDTEGNVCNAMRYLPG